MSTFSNRVEAETARSALTAHAIESRLVGDDGGGVGIPMSLEHQGLEVHVAQDDLETAREVLELSEEPRVAKPMSWLGRGLIGATIVLIAIVIAIDVTS